MGTVVFFDEKNEWGSRHKAVYSYAGDWFNRDQYHKYDMSWIRVESQFQRGLQPGQFTEVRWWMQDNLEGEVMVVYDDRTSSGGGVNVYLYFQHETDMVAFKLRWE